MGVLYDNDRNRFPADEIDGEPAAGCFWAFLAMTPIFLVILYMLFN